MALMSSDEMAEALGVTRQQIGRYAVRKRRPLPAERVSGRWVCERGKFLRWKREIFPTIQTRGQARRGKPKDQGA